ncbi:MAG: dihydroorotase [Ferruginibacter sp.]
MIILLKQARIISSTSSHHHQLKDILIENGLIKTIAENIDATADHVIFKDNLHVSIGWMDVFSFFGEPGYEHKETLETGAAAAAAGGFTDVMVLPNTQPVVSTKSQVAHLKNQSAALPVSIHPIGSVTKNAEGKELAEMYDMHDAQAIGFSDGINAIQQPGMMLKALQYVTAVNSSIIQIPDDKTISAHGLMNEGITSTQLGLPGKPAIAEELMIARDIELLRYTNSKLHITGVSTQKGIELINAAKKQGLNITCSVSPYHCLLSDEDLVAYDSNLKVNPPLRTKADMLALQKAVINGDIDCIASHHLPQHNDDKQCEFEYAKNGMETLEIVFVAINSFHTNLDALIEMFSIAPRTIFNQPIATIEEGQPASLTLFDPAPVFTFTDDLIVSKSHNNAFVGRQLKGTVVGIIHKNRVYLNAHG